MHLLGRRYTGIFLDPVLACNLRCKMCYFSDEEKRKNYRGIFSYEDMELIAAALFSRALKLQIGCGAEPTLHKDLSKIIALGKQYRIPYISLTTNGNLLTKDTLSDAVQAGLNEITLSTHGLTKKTYEYLMTNGNFDIFKQTLQYIGTLKTQYPNFKLRINYTINNDNLDELDKIWELIGSEVDILQIRPVQKIGNPEYADFDLTRIYNRYDTLITPVADECKRRKITCLVPSKENILVLKKDEMQDGRIEAATYCYVSPRGCWKDDFDYKTETFESYARKHHVGRRMFADLFAKSEKKKTNVSHKMNYSIK
ncbi:MAG: radical SAM protein [Tannerella sp.]|nr:radical SAM protein [Tannerella sp.]